MRFLQKLPRAHVLVLDEISLFKGHRDFATLIGIQDKDGIPILLAALKRRENQTVVESLLEIASTIALNKFLSRCANTIGG
jgi:hypothetical protein